MPKRTEIYADTAAARLYYRDFIIEESIVGWEWSHIDMHEPNAEGYDVSGICQTVFEAIEEAMRWHGDA